jgi:hypothetical protein
MSEWAKEGEARSEQAGDVFDGEVSEATGTQVEALFWCTGAAYSELGCVIKHFLSG